MTGIDRGSENLSVKDQRINISGFAGHTVFHDYSPLPLHHENRYGQYVNEQVATFQFIHDTEI